MSAENGERREGFGPPYLPGEGNQSKLDRHKVREDKASQALRRGRYMDKGELRSRADRDPVSAYAL